jgi:tRNA threonylcarbamoyladenosine biosynthesis protein TsaB
LFHNSEYHFHEILPKQHTERLLIEIKKLLRLANAELKELDAIAVGCGPGSFTGIRLACSVAQGLAFSNDLKTIQVSSLEVLAKNIYDKFKSEDIVSIVNARMKQLYVGEFLYSEQGLIKANLFVSPIEGFELKAYNKNTFFVGDGCVLIEKKLNKISKNLLLNLPSAKDLLELAKDKYAKDELLDPSKLLPVYLSGEEQWKKA